MFNKKKKEAEFDKKVTINFNTVQLQFSEDDKKENLEEILKNLLKELPNVQDSYAKTPDDRWPENKLDYIDAYNHWFDSLSQASNVVMSILRKRPRTKDGQNFNNIDSVHITDNLIKID